VVQHGCWICKLLIVACFLSCLHALTTCFDSPCSSCLLQIDKPSRNKKTNNNKCQQPSICVK
jgi:hypothetical protein